MKKIPFLQYLLPDGKTAPINIEMPDEIGRLADEILQGGRYRFEAEVLTTGHCSFTCFDILKQEDITIQICTNGPCVVGAVEKLIRDTWEVLHGNREPEGSARA